MPSCGRPAPWPVRISGRGTITAEVRGRADVGGSTARAFSTTSRLQTFNQLYPDNDSNRGCNSPHLRYLSSHASPASDPLKVVVGMSGGVDSSVTAALLLKRGFRVAGCFMRNWNASDEAGAGLDNEPCPADADYASAKSVADKLGIPLFTANFEQEYWTGVFEPMLEMYRRGHTPNPDALCNRHVKFDAFRKHALRTIGADCLATGHYGQIWPPIVDPSAPLPPQHASGVGESDYRYPYLASGVDGGKDQSDFLALVHRRDLQRVMLPLGSYRKSQIRAMADFFGLPSAKRKDSYGICFVGERSMRTFLGSYMTLRTGHYQDITTGANLPGQCEAVEVVTAGQSARISGQATRYFVVRTGLQQLQQRHKEAATAEPPPDAHSLSSRVWVCPGQHHPALYSDTAAVDLATIDVELLPSQLQQAFAAARARGPDAAQKQQFATMLHEWLHRNSPTLPFPAASGSLAEAQLQPFRVAYRDRHRQDEMRTGAVIFCWGSEWVAACDKCRLPPVQRPEGTAWMPSGGLPVDGTDGASGDGSVGDKLILAIRFDMPHRAVAPGQTLVLYSAEQAPAGMAVATTPDSLPADIAPAAAAASSPDGQSTSTAAWEGAGRVVYGGGSILSAGPSWWDMGLTGAEHTMPHGMAQMR